MSGPGQFTRPLTKAQAIMREQMEKPDNIAKPSWLDTPLSDLFHELDRNAAMLQMADTAEDAWRRAANVANFAWMVADKIERSLA